MDYTYDTSVSCTTEVIGFHNWPEAIEPVNYLRSPHRHKFGITVELPVVHADRQIEFHALRRQVENLVYLLEGVNTDDVAGTGEVNFGRRSCEDIARELLEGLRKIHYPDLPWYRVTVDEDGENSATVEAQAA